MTTRRGLWIAVPAAAVLAVGVAACGDDPDGGGGGTAGGLTGEIAIDGSSMVFPFAQAAAEQFQTENPDVTIRVGRSGAHDGFAKLCAGRTDIADASRPIDPGCEKKGTEYTKVRIEAGDRPLFMYPSERALRKPEVKAFMEFVVGNAEAIADAARIVVAPPNA